MRAITIAALLVMGLATTVVEAQFVGIPKTFQPSLDAAKSRVRLTNPALTAAPSVKDTLYRIGDALGMLRDIEERDAILTMDWRATGTMLVDGQSCVLANYRGQVRYSVPPSVSTMRARSRTAKPGGGTSR